MKFPVSSGLKPLALPAGVVILVAAILFMYYRHQTRELQRQHTLRLMKTLGGAIEEFSSTWGFLPPPPYSPTEGVDCESDTSDDERFVLLLMGISDTLGIRKINFLARMEPVDFEDGKPVGGLHLSDELGVRVLDSWGNHFRVLLDFDLNDKVTNPNPNGNPRELSKRFVIWSAGPDRKFDTWSDNVVSWNSPD